MTQRHVVALSTHGGKREGAGRKPSPSPPVFVGVRLTSEERDYLKELGNGNISAGVRKAIQATREATHT